MLLSQLAYTVNLSVGRACSFAPAEYSREIGGGERCVVGSDILGLSFLMYIVHVPFRVCSMVRRKYRRLLG